MSVQEEEVCWMVAGIPFEPGHPAPTFGPFDTREEADQCAAAWPGRHVYDAVANRKSNCGPWYL